MASTPRFVRWLIPVVLVVAWVGIGATFGPYAGRLSEVSTNDQAAFLPRSAESTRVLDAQKRFHQAETLPAIVVWTSDTGSVSPAQRDQAARALTAAASVDGVLGKPSPVLPSKDGRALQGVLQLRPDLGTELTGTVNALRSAAGAVDGTRAQVAGPAATQADLSDAFAGIDGLLLGVALLAVLVILLLVYRSILMPFLIILSAVFALGLASAVVYALADHNAVRVDGQVQGILSILVIGAATDYALLLTARFREELAVSGDRFAAARAALRRSVAAITASAATVALGLLALLLSDLTNNRALGPVGAIGIGCAVLVTLTFLPAVLLLLGRAAYWPGKPRPSDTDSGGHGLWRRVAARIDRGPRLVWAGTLILLAVFAAFAPALRSEGVPLDETFVNKASSVEAQKSLDAHFPGGSGQPVVLIAPAARERAVTAAAARTHGVSEAASPAGRHNKSRDAYRSGRHCGTPRTATRPRRRSSACGTRSGPSAARRRWWAVTRLSSTTRRRPRHTTGSSSSQSCCSSSSSSSWGCCGPC